jgi:hypothetical protein
MDPTGRRSIKFQWARLHPATVIAGTEDKDTIVELSRKFHEYQDAASQRKKEGAGAEEEVYDLYLTENITIDLCELFKIRLSCRTCEPV